MRRRTGYDFPGFNGPDSEQWVLFLFSPSSSIVVQIIASIITFDREAGRERSRNANQLTLPTAGQLCSCCLRERVKSSSVGKLEVVLCIVKIVKIPIVLKGSLCPSETPPSHSSLPPLPPSHH